MNEHEKTIADYEALTERARSILVTWAAEQKNAPHARNMGIHPQNLRRLRTGVDAVWSPDLVRRVLEESKKKL